MYLLQLRNLFKHLLLLSFWRVNAFISHNTVFTSEQNVNKLRTILSWVTLTNSKVAAQNMSKSNFPCVYQQRGTCDAVTQPQKTYRNSCGARKTIMIGRATPLPHKKLANVLLPVPRYWNLVSFGNSLLVVSETVTKMKIHKTVPQRKRAQQNTWASGLWRHEWSAF